MLFDAATAQQFCSSVRGPRCAHAALAQSFLKHVTRELQSLNVQPPSQNGDLACCTPFMLQINGEHRDDLLYKGDSVPGLPEGVVVYFPPASAVNPRDARDGEQRLWFFKFALLASHVPGGWRPGGGECCLEDFDALRSALEISMQLRPPLGYLPAAACMPVYSAGCPCCGRAA